MEYGLLRKGSIQTEGGLTMAEEYIEREDEKALEDNNGQKR